MADVEAAFDGMYVRRKAHGPHHLQIHTDDDELDMAVYVFDDHYRAANPGKADFLLNDGWQLPAEAAPVGSFAPSTSVNNLFTWRGEGASYLCFLAYYDSHNFDLAGPYCVPGARLPALAQALLTECLDVELRGENDLIRAQLEEHLYRASGEEAGFLTAIQDDPEEQTHWLAYTDWLVERDRPPASLHLLECAVRTSPPRYEYLKGRDPNKDLHQFTPHLIQVCKHIQTFGSDDLYHQWILFDDLWAAAHPSLANGILTFASCWDVLS
jgi:uncharacterized protein (TIGR02996 family)